ncbi:MAG: ArsR family transcriptional regulator, partial [Actinomycetota bacterium]|nr:ArsR family transcriptional regulator [Actinomycetota bacterium]
APIKTCAVSQALFVCTHNSARSQLAAALWRHLTGQAADSAGTSPADRVHPEAIAAGRRAGIQVAGVRPRQIDDLDELPALVITVCDRAHEELDTGSNWLHWSIRDPVPLETPAAFDAARDELHERITLFVGSAA